MKTIYDLSELSLPATHINTLHLLFDNIKKSGLDLQKIILFGSCAREEAFPTSDLDIIIVGPADDDNKFHFAFMDCEPDPYDNVPIESLYYTAESFDNGVLLPFNAPWYAVREGVAFDDTLFRRA
ncbi:MAG: nucleotidyltransferase domain-containing protein [Defluviitaleaceae bacterium]|nr:nucleotidyltransferase domain-containing protein [Defluviitaleaceae bacterium]